MKVWELMAHLRAMPQEAEVAAYGYDDGNDHLLPGESLTKISEVLSIDNKFAPQFVVLK
jgi:hypothetical protein